MLGKSFYGVSAAVVGVAGVVLVQPQVAIPQTLEEQAIAAIAREVTVVINGQNPGSGAIVSKNGSRYTVLTAKHVVATPDEYEIVTFDGVKHPLDYSSVKKLPGLDLAVAQFTSDRNYLVAPVGNADAATEGTTVYISGWPHPGRAITDRIFQIASGKISGRPMGSLEDGYALVYTNTTRAGMSGGPIFDANAVVIGIHGHAEGEPIFNPDSGDTVDVKSGFNLGIPINPFLDFAAGEKISLSFFGDNFFADLDGVKKLLGHRNQVNAVEVAPDNRTIVSGSFDSTIKLWDLQTGKELQTLTGHSSGVIDLEIAPDGKTLASGSFDDTIKLWDLQAGKELRTLTGHANDVLSVAFAQDSQTLASGGNDGFVKIWNAKTGELLHTLERTDLPIGLRSAFDRVGFSPDGQTVVAADINGKISRWNVQTGEFRSGSQTRWECSDQVTPFILSPREEKIAGVCTTEDTIQVWNAITGQLLYTIDMDAAALAINRYGQLLAGVQSDGRILIWNLQTGELLRKSERLFDPEGGYYALFTSVAFSADGQTLVAGARSLPAGEGPGYLYVFSLAKR